MAGRGESFESAGEVKNSRYSSVESTQSPRKQVQMPEGERKGGKAKNIGHYVLGKDR